jgi:hypothetical protein
VADSYLENDLGVPRENQHLQFLGEDLQDWRTLAYYQIGAERITAEERAMEASTQAKADAERKDCACLGWWQRSADAILSTAVRL